MKQLSNTSIWAMSFGLIAVALGAFGAHALDGELTVYQESIYEKAVYYQFIHAILLLWLSSIKSNQWIIWSRRVLIFGIIFFSGSLYLIACKDLFGWNSVGILGPMTPAGGVGLIGGWGVGAVGVYQLKIER